LCASPTTGSTGTGPETATSTTTNAAKAKQVQTETTIAPIASTTTDSEVDPSAPTPVKRPRMMRTISSMEESVLAALIQRVPSYRQLISGDGVNSFHLWRLEKKLHSNPFWKPGRRRRWTIT
jgi:hypothetical protein